jgi:hypothetical protein
MGASREDERSISPSLTFKKFKIEEKRKYTKY